MKTVLFDFGGTIDTNGVHWSEKFWEFYQKFNLGVAKNDFERAFVKSEAMLVQDPDLQRATFYETLKRQLKLQFVILDIHHKNGSLAEVVDACYEDVQACIDQARELLDDLHQKQYSLGLVSNFYGNLGVVCKEFHLDELFPVQIDSVCVGVRKPDPAIFALALKECKAQPGETFVIGDSYERDIVPSKQLGCSTIWLKGKSWTAHPTNTKSADHTITSLEQVRNILLKNTVHSM